MTAPQLSQQAFDRLQAEFDDLTTRGRIEVANKIERAREEGDLKENAGYHAAKDEQGHMEGRIRQLEHLLENAEIVDAALIYTVVYEGDPDDMAERYLIGNMEEHTDGADVISATSPLGAALRDAEKGQTITYDAPTGPLTVKVLDVEQA
jgi:transcription elongation factor GreA